jgi:hypothetical protein
MYASSQRLFILFILLLLGGCSSTPIPEAMRQQLAARWMAVGSTDTLEITAFGRYQLILAGNPSIVFSGRVERGNDIIRFIGSPQDPCASTMGSYRFIIHDNQLDLYRIEDKCVTRRLALKQTFERQTIAPPLR